VGAVGGVTGVRSVLSNTRRLGLRGDPFDVRHLCSFSAETEVVMADGTTKPISEVEVGDWVVAEDPETGERGVREVTRLWVHQDTIVDLEVDGHDVATTEDHPFWNHTDGQWQRADVLDPGDLLLTADGTTLTVGGLDWGSVRTATAYNLSVDDIHTYFVAVGDNEVLVHNTNTCATNSRALVDAGKYDYLFGNVSSNPHNLARSLQNQRQLNGIGVFDNAAGRNLLSAHFDEVVSTNSNVLRTWSDEFGTFQARESLLAGPHGLLKLESTWQVTSDGLRLTTVIPFGGG
jgi:hypothetical protein